MRPCTPDDKALTGPLKEASNVIINTGHGGRGITQGFASSKLIADLISGSDNHSLIEQFLPERFNL